MPVKTETVEPTPTRVLSHTPHGGGIPASDHSVLGVSAARNQVIHTDSVKMRSMAPVAGRARQPRADRLDKHLLSAWVKEDLRQKVRDVAEAAGISQAMYLSALIRRDELDPNGVPLWFEPDPDQHQEELPLKTA